jgi:large subunit ribosomal protein L6
MVIGVKEGYEKKLELQGVGYVCQVAGKQLKLRVGLANELVKTIPEGLDVTCPDQTHVDIKGCDKQKVGQFAAEIRSLRKPEPYKGKGIRYVGEHVKIKAGKSAQ